MTNQRNITKDEYSNLLCDMYSIGIDPNLSAFAVCIMYNKKVFRWFTVLLKKKDQMGKATDWSNYISDQCDYMYIDILESIIQHSGNKTNQIFIVIEQQRGRIMSILESILLAKARSHNIPNTHVLIAHPRTWKKAIYEFSTDILGNNANKKESERIELQNLKDYCHLNNIEMPIRTHDLCDAKLIARYAEQLNLKV